MPSGENFDFNLEKQRAAERLRELNARSKYKTGNTGINRPDCSVHNDNRPQGFLSQLHIPFLSNLGSDPDTALILGLVLILTAEKSDKLLLLALLYILI